MVRRLLTAYFYCLKNLISWFSVFQHFVVVVPLVAGVFSVTIFFLVYNIWKKVTEWTDKQDGGISSGLAEKDFDTNFKEYQDCKGKGDNMVESKEKALAPFLGTADALWIRVNTDDDLDGNTANNVLLSDITVKDIGEGQIQTQIPQQQMPPQLSNNQPLETLNNRIPEKNFEPLVEAPKHNYGQKINDFLGELQASLSYQVVS